MLAPRLLPIATLLALVACEDPAASRPPGPDTTTLPPAVAPGPGSWVIPRRDVMPLYRDGRPTAAFEMRARDVGVVLRHGDGPDSSDAFGARDVWAYEADGTYYLHYDAAGPRGWLVALATSPDLEHWTKRGLVLDLGAADQPDSRTASYGVTYRDRNAWHLFYLGATQTMLGPGLVPMGPYVTLKARADSPAGPWRKQRDVIPFWPTPGTFYAHTASPGPIVRHDGEYLQLFSAAEVRGDRIFRTIGLARTTHLDSAWRVSDAPLLPPEEQVENAALYHQESDGTWFMFVNHVGMNEHGIEYTDAIWVYWTHDPLRWEPERRAVVMDARTSTWAKRIVGLPSVLRVGDRLALLYDGRAGTVLPSGTGQHMDRDVGLAWLELPLVAR